MGDEIVDELQVFCVENKLIRLSIIMLFNIAIETVNLQGKQECLAGNIFRYIYLDIKVFSS